MLPQALLAGALVVFFSWLLRRFGGAKLQTLVECDLGDVRPASARNEPGHVTIEMGSLDSISVRDAAATEVEQLTPAQLWSLLAKGRFLGNGSFGDVREAVLPGGKRVAVKVNRTVATLQQEVDVLRVLHHENIIQFYGCCTTGGDMFIFMELATGSLTQRGRMSEGKAQYYMRQILHGLRYLHDFGIVHRDIKCDNILIDDQDVAKLADFGLSKALIAAANRSRQGCSSVVGTRYWMAPEVLRGDAYGTKADVWSVGCAAVEMLNGGYGELKTFANDSAMNDIGHPSIPNTVTADCRKFLMLCFDRDASRRASVAELLQHSWLTSTTGNADR